MSGKKIYIDVYASCDKSVSDCDTVLLCLDKSWKNKVHSGIPLIPGNVVNIAKFEGKSLKKTGCGAGISCSSYCRYQVEVRADLFKYDPENFIPYVPCSDDVLDIVPSCAFSHILEIIEGISSDTASMSVDYDARTFTFTPAVGDPLVVDACTLTSGCSGGGGGSETPNSKIDSDSVQLVLSGSYSRTIRADVRIAPGLNALFLTSNGLKVDPVPPPALSTGCGIALSGNTLSARTSGTWGSGALTYPACTATDGAPIYCDGSGNLRVAPTHATICGAHGWTGAIPGNAPVSALGTDLIDTARYTEIFNNSCRTMEVMYTVNSNVNMVLYTLGVWKFTTEISIGGGAWNPFTQTQWGTFPGVMGMPWLMVGSGRLTIPPKSSRVVGLRNRIQTLVASAVGSYYVSGNLGLTYIGSTRDIGVA